MPWEHGNRKRKISPETRAAIIEARRGGMSYRDLSAMYGASNYTVHLILTGAGLVRPRGSKKAAVVVEPGAVAPKHTPHADLRNGVMPEWMVEGACAQFGPRWFFPDEDELGRGNKGTTYAEGRRVCADCPVRAECLQYALDTREPHGLWGGATPRERARMIRALQDPEVA